jgi:hypothetical protein
MDVAGLHPGGVTGRDHRPSQEFEVQLRFDLSPDGIAAPTAQRRAAVAGILQKLIDDAQAALADVNAGAASTVITVHVPVVNRPQRPVNDFEVVVRWR